ncbi:Major Facilitator Superfamily protein [compost metagenome]
MLLAACVSHRLPSGRPAGATPAASATGGWRGYWAVLRNPRALCVIFGAALPARLVAVTVLAVVVPLQMNALQQPAAMTGRVLLLYFLVFASTVSLCAHWSDASGKRQPFLVAGGLVSALACWTLPGLGGVLGMAAGCALLGLGQALQSSPQLALVTEIFEYRQDSRPLATPEQALAAFRLLERLGSIAAPFVTAAAVAAFGYAGAMLAMGIFLATATLGMLLGLRTPPLPALSFARSP